MTQNVQVVAAAHPIKSAQTCLYLPEGLTIQEMVERVKPPYFESFPVSVLVDGHPIPEIWWDGCRPKSNALVNINVVPMGGGGGGGKNPLRTVLTLAIMVAAPYAGPAIGGALGLSTSATVFGVSVNLASAVGGALFSVAGRLLVNAIAPPGAQSSQTPGLQRADPKRDSPTYFVEGARNEKRPDAPVPVILGRIRHTPPLGADNFTESAGDQQYVRQVFAWGHGPLQISDLRFGETPIDQYEDVEIETDTGTAGAAPDLTLYPNDVEQEEFSIQIFGEADWSVRRSALSADELVVDLTWPQGLASYDSEGRKKGRTISYQIEYSVADADTWVSWIDTTIKRSFTSAIRESHRLSVTRGQYDIRVRKTSSDSDSAQVIEDMYWTSLKTITNEPPILMENLAATALRIRATDQLTGVIDRLTALCETVCLDWDSATQTWVERTTNNPASLFRYVLQSGAIDEPLPDSRIDLSMLQDWHEFCESNEYTYNFVVDFETTVDAILADIAAAGRAASHSLDGIRTVVIDREQTVYRQAFTPDNTFDFKGEIVFAEEIHGWRIGFKNEDADFKFDERIVYADGYSAANATKIRDLDLPGVTNPDQVYKQAREHIATITLRPEIFTFSMDYEHLTAVKGDLCALTHDVPLFGLATGRIKTVTTDGGDPENVVSIELDEEVAMETGKSYSVRYRRADGQQYTRTVRTVVGTSNQLEFLTPFTVDETPAVGDLFQFGELSSVSVDVIIQSIRRTVDYKAQIVCVHAAPEIFQASQGEIPAFDSQITLPADLKRPVAPIIKAIQTGEEVMVRSADGSVATRMVITLENQNSGLIEPVIKIRNTIETSFGQAQIISATPDQIVLEGLDDGERYDLLIYYRRIGGTRVLSSEFSPPAVQNGVLFEGASARPDDIQNFKLSVLGEVAQLSWDPVANIDFSHYEVRYSPELSGVSWGAAQVLRSFVLVNESTVALQPGTYLVKAVDRSSLYSENAAIVITSVTAQGFNVVETVVEDNTFTGTKTNLRVESDQLILDDASLLAGTYTFANSIDQGAVYTSRVKPNVIARGTVIGSNLNTWGPLNTLASLSGGATPQDWSIDVQFRTTDDDPTGSPTWTAWESLVLGNYTFRAIEFLIVLRTEAPNITPAISKLEVEVDMPDRIYPLKNVLIPVDGARVDFTPEFKSLSSVLITAQSLSTGDYMVKTNESETGVDLEFFNSADASIARTVDITAIGYGSKQ